MSDEIRPPYVRFEERAVEDREAAEAAGHYVAKGVEFAIITPPGSRDTVEKEAQQWLKDMEKAAKDQRIPTTWPMHFKAMYQAWKEGQELPEKGTPIRTWPALSAAQVETIISANIRTVEDLAEASETALAAIGIGAVTYKQRAKAWLEAASKVGKPAEKLASLEIEVENLKKSSEAKDKKIEELKTELESLKKESV